MDIKNKLQLKQELVLTKQLVLLAKLLTLNSLDLYEYLQKVSIDNVFIDFDYEPNFVVSGIPSKQSPEDGDFTNFYFEQEDIIDNLKKQVTFLNLDKKTLKIYLYLIDSLDEKGYLFDSTEDISEIFKVNKDLVDQALNIIQGLEPKGVGSRNLKECLLLQVDNELVKTIIDNHLELVADNRLKELAHLLDEDIEIIIQAIEIIKSLNPYPFNGYYKKSNIANYIVPEIILNDEEPMTYTIQSNFTGKIKLNAEYLDLYNSGNVKKRELSKYYNEANLLIRTLENRDWNISKITEEILERQKGFFYRKENLRPMLQKEVAESCGISNSTVSRVVSNKFIQTKSGVYLLKDLFSYNIDGFSHFEIKDKIYKLIELEDKNKPFTDQEITKLLNDQNIAIKRRTVTKYRQELKLNSSKKRKHPN